MKLVIKTSPNEGEKHIKLKEKAIELLKRRKDIIKISSEYPIKTKRGKYFKHADVFAEKENGSIYVEVKTGPEFFSGMEQLRAMDDGNINNEFILICNFNDMLMTRKVARDWKNEFRTFVNRIQIYNFDEECNLIYRDIYVNKFKEIRIDGKREG